MMNLLGLLFALFTVVVTISAEIQVGNNETSQEVEDEKKPADKRVFGTVRVEGKRAPSWMERILQNNSMNMNMKSRIKKRSYSQKWNKPSGEDKTEAFTQSPIIPPEVRPVVMELLADALQFEDKVFSYQKLLHQVHLSKIMSEIGELRGEEVDCEEEDEEGEVGESTGEKRGFGTSRLTGRSMLATDDNHMDRYRRIFGTARVNSESAFSPEDTKVETRNVGAMKQAFRMGPASRTIPDIYGGMVGRYVRGGKKRSDTQERSLHADDEAEVRELEEAVGDSKRRRKRSLVVELIPESEEYDEMKDPAPRFYPKRNADIEWLYPTMSERLWLIPLLRSRMQTLHSAESNEETKSIFKGAGRFGRLRSLENFDDSADLDDQLLTGQGWPAAYKKRVFGSSRLIG